MVSQGRRQDLHDTVVGQTNCVVAKSLLVYLLLSSKNLVELCLFSKEHNKAH